MLIGVLERIGVNPIFGLIGGSLNSLGMKQSSPSPASDDEPVAT
jgi:hypothetical protein